MAPHAETETRTEHCVIRSSATPHQTRMVADAVEALCREYVRVFREYPGVSGKVRTLQLHLYRDRAEFRRATGEAGWAEATYDPPWCHAYFHARAANPVHWMLHEAAHQLTRETALIDAPQWIDEGLASYFGSSQLSDGALRAGEPDAHAYPVWWLRRIKWTGDLAADIRGARVIPLRAIVTGRGGPDVDARFNLYYVEWWTLTHFLVEYGDGKYRPAYFETIRAGGSLQAFEEHIGPIGRIEEEWYSHLLALRASLVRP